MELPMSTNATNEQTVQRAGRREWIGLAVIALPCLLYSMDLTVLNLAIPHLIADLEPSSTELLWIVDIYGFLIAGSLITMGTLGDRIGRRRLLMIGAATFGVASVIAAFSRTAEMLVASRALLGVAGATLAPSTLSLIRNMFHDPGQRTVAIGVWGTSFSVGGAIGPLLGGMLLEHFWWGSVFLLAVPVMALLLVFGPMLLPEYRDPNAGRIDLTSAALSLAAVLSTIYGLKTLAAYGATPVAVLSVLAGITIGVVFVRRQRTLADPFIDLRLFRAPAFNAALGVNVLGCFMIFGSFLYSAQYFQLMLGLSPLEAGLWMLPSAITVTIGSLVAPVVVRRLQPATVIAGGLALVAAGFVLLTQLGEQSLALLVIGSMVFSIGLGPVFILTTDLILGSAPPERAGAASAISETGAELGGAVGIASLGSIATAVYRLRVDDHLTAVPAEAREAARETLGTALAAAERLPRDLGAAVAEAARGAFVDAFHVVAAANVVIAVALAIIVVIVLRKRQSPSTAASESEPRPDAVAA
jgi:MFS transporter, DHA2 family, multidrug resistance protein